VTIKRWAPWVVLAIVLVGALAIGSQHKGKETLDAHVRRIAAQIKCPTCQGESAADSNAASSQAIRDEIRTRLQQGQSDSEIRGFLVSRFGRDILLKPPASGVSGLVWALPVVAFVAAVAGLVVCFRRWRRMQEAW
jgi:cytochrome c-type biogenesis protein CcmH